MSEAVLTFTNLRIRWVISLNDVLQRWVLLEVPALLARVCIKSKPHQSATRRAAFELMRFLPSILVNHGGKYTPGYVALRNRTGHHWDIIGPH